MKNLRCRGARPLAFLAFAVALLVLVPQPVPADQREGRTWLGIKGTGFTLNDRPTFLLGVSYYSALGASEETIRQDLDEMRRRGFNWIRVWATWGAFDNEVSAVDAEGNARKLLLSARFAQRSGNSTPSGWSPPPMPATSRAKNWASICERWRWIS